MSVWLAIRRRHLHGALAVALSAYGCSSRSCGCDRSEDTAAEDEPEEVAVPPDSDVEVLSNGSKPRVTLRVARWTGLKYRVTTETNGSSGLEGQPPAHAPTVTMTLMFEVLRGTADPIVRHADGSVQRLVEERAVLESLRVRHESAPPQMVEDFNRGLLALRGSTMRQMILESGELVELESELLGGKSPPPEVKEAIDGALEGQRRFPFRLPPVPVGVGAKWRFRQTITVNGARVVQIADMALRSFDDQLAKVHFSLRMQAARQPVPHPLQPGATAMLDIFRGDGDGEATIDRLTGIAVKGRLMTATRFTLSGDVGGRPAAATVFETSVITSTAEIVDEDSENADFESRGADGGS